MHTYIFYNYEFLHKIRSCKILHESVLRLEMVLQISFAVRLLLFSERKVCSGTCKMHSTRTIAQRQTCTPRSIIISFSSPRGIRQERKKSARRPLTKPTTRPDGSRSFCTALGDPLRARCVNQNRTGDIRNRDCTKTGTMNHWRIELNASQPLNMRTQALSAYWAQIEDFPGNEIISLIEYRFRVPEACEHQVCLSLIKKNASCGEKSRVKRTRRSFSIASS